MGDKSKKSSFSKPASSKSISKTQKSTDAIKESKTKKSNKGAAKKGSCLPSRIPTEETILIAPPDYVPVFHRDMKVVGSTSPGSPANGTCDQEDKNVVSKNNPVKNKKSATQQKTLKERAVSKKTKASSQQVKSARPKSTKKTNMVELQQQQPKMASYVVKALNLRIDNFAKQYDHNCNPKCNCSKNKGRKSKKKSKVANK